MGQKVNPIGFRLPLRKDWKSRWFARSKEKEGSINKSFGELLQEDLKIRKRLDALLKNASVSKVVIERFGRRLRLTIYTSKPGIVITGHFDERNDRRAAKPAAPAAVPAQGQISLLDLGGQTVLKKLEMTDVNVLSPIEALNLLAELKEDLRG